MHAGRRQEWLHFVAYYLLGIAALSLVAMLLKWGLKLL